jgi:hypothetical protein
LLLLNLTPSRPIRKIESAIASASLLQVRESSTTPGLEAWLRGPATAIKNQHRNSQGEYR